MSKYRITVEGKTYEMDVELIGANGVAVQPVAKVAAPVVSAPKAAPDPVAAKPAEVGSGSVVVIGGLKEYRSVRYEDKLPVLGDLPMVGRLFRSEGEEKIRKAFLMFVKVDVVDPTGRNVGTGERPSDAID